MEAYVGESQLEVFGTQGRGTVLAPALCSAIGLYRCGARSVIPNPPDGGSRLAAEATVTELLQDLTAP